MNSIKHIAIIMDGNGRWGENKNKNRNFGHKEGLKSVEKIVYEAIKKKYLSYHCLHFLLKIGKDPKKK